MPKRRGQCAPILAVSRRGQLSRGHPRTQAPNFGSFIGLSEPTASELVRAVRQAVKDAEAQGLSWHPVFDTLRAQGPEFWKLLPIDECRRIVRHLRPFWDAHRFRVAPQVEAVLDTARAEGTLEIVAGSVASVTTAGESIEINIRARRDRKIVQRTVDAVVVTTGPAHCQILRTVPFLRDLAAGGLLRLDSVGLGLDVTRRFRAIRAGGVAVDRLLVAGPLARGTFGELMGLPEVCMHAREVAREIARTMERPSLRSAPASPPPPNWPENRLADST